MGVPISWLGGSRRLKARGSEVAAEMVRHPGSFFSAIGLALQGIGRASLDVNLLVSEQRSVLGRLSLGGSKNVATAAWGLDLGDSALKVVRLVSPASGGDPVIANCALIPHPHPLSQPGKESERSDLLEQALSKFAQRFQISKGEAVCLNMPANRVLSRVMALPDVPDKKLVLLLKHEVAHRIPVPLDDLSWAFQRLGTSAGNEGLTQRILFSAARSSEVHNRLSICNEFEIPVNILQSDAAALHNFVCFDLLSSQAGQEAVGGVGIVDVGSETTSLVVSSPTVAWFRSIQVGGNDFTNAIIKEFQLTSKQGEVVKREPARSKSLKNLYAVFDPLFKQLNDEVQRSLEFYKKELAGEPVQRLLATGGGFRLHGLLRYFMFGQ